MIDFSQRYKLFRRNSHTTTRNDLKIRYFDINFTMHIRRLSGINMPSINVHILKLKRFIEVAS